MVFVTLSRRDPTTHSYIMKYLAGSLCALYKSTASSQHKPFFFKFSCYIFLCAFFYKLSYCASGLYVELISESICAWNHGALAPLTRYLRAGRRYAVPLADPVRLVPAHISTFTAKPGSISAHQELPSLPLTRPAPPHEASIIENGTRASNDSLVPATLSLGDAVEIAGHRCMIVTHWLTCK